MNRDTLLQRRQTAEQRFKELQQQCDAKRQEVADLEDELKRLQGQWREINELLALTAEPAPQASTITAEPAGEAAPAKESHGRQPVKR